jgi:hypothetical protein
VLPDPEDEGIAIFRNVKKYKLTRHNNPAGLSFHQRRCQKIKSRKEPGVHLLTLVIVHFPLSTWLMTYLGLVLLASP